LSLKTIDNPLTMVALPEKKEKKERRKKDILG